MQLDRLLVNARSHGTSSFRLSTFNYSWCEFTNFECSARACNCGYVNYTFAFPFHFNKLINSYFLPLVHSSQRLGCQLSSLTQQCWWIVFEKCVRSDGLFALWFFFIVISRSLYSIHSSWNTIFFFFIGMNLNKQTDTHTLEAQWTLECSSNFFSPPTFPFQPQVCSLHTRTQRVLVHSVFIFGSMLWARRAYWLLF